VARDTQFLALLHH